MSGQSRSNLQKVTRIQVTTGSELDRDFVGSTFPREKKEDNYANV